MKRTVFRCRNAGLRVVRTKSTANCAASWTSAMSHPFTPMYFRPGWPENRCAIHPDGVRVLMPNPLSSHTISNGIGMP